MSHMIDGKIANQIVGRTMSGKALCACCSIMIDPPGMIDKKIGEETFLFSHYIRKEQYIYETKRGRAVVYCSDWCRRKHNHRFRR